MCKKHTTDALPLSPPCPCPSLPPPRSLPLWDRRHDAAPAAVPRHGSRWQPDLWHDPQGVSGACPSGPTGSPLPPPTSPFPSPSTHWRGCRRDPSSPRPLRSSHTGRTRDTRLPASGRTCWGRTESVNRDAPPQRLRSGRPYTSRSLSPDREPPTSRRYDFLCPVYLLPAKHADTKNKYIFNRTTIHFAWHNILFDKWCANNNCTWHAWIA